MASVTNQTVQTGNTVYFMIKNVPIARAQSISAERSFGTTGVYQIGSIMPQEHVTNRYEGSISMERFFVREQGLHELGYSSVNERILQTPIFTIEVIDKYTGKLARAYHGCTAVNYRETFRVGAICGENATWTYLFAKSSITDESKLDMGKVGK